MRTTFLKHLSALALAIASGAVSTQASATTTETYCGELTPARLAVVSTKLDAALADAKAAITLTGNDPESVSAYPAQEIRNAITHWNLRFQYFGPSVLEPYITASNVALWLEGSLGLQMIWELRHARVFATTGAYQHYGNPAAQKKFLESRKTIQNAIDEVEKIATIGTRCSIAQAFPAGISDLPNAP